ncbi:hypothetical protein MKW98_030232 [Papaver atlanticum]|uniref:Uncharacterized protein n=1 Tax=Papaver atlanticum TaxID=357466 RepID=A0AAD4SZ59_9MAGN|nr:hypothetical protein MKW98_030232 [Papaver atlanticum]
MPCSAHNKGLKNAPKRIPDGYTLFVCAGVDDLYEPPVNSEIHIQEFEVFHGDHQGIARYYELLKELSTTWYKMWLWKESLEAQNVRAYCGWRNSKLGCLAPVLQISYRFGFGLSCLCQAKISYLAT